MEETAQKKPGHAPALRLYRLLFADDSEAGVLALEGEQIADVLDVLGGGALPQALPAYFLMMKHWPVGR